MYNNAIRFGGKLDELLWYFRMGNDKIVKVRGTDQYATVQSQAGAIKAAIKRNRCNGSVKCITRKGECFLVKAF